MARFLNSMCILSPIEKDHVPNISTKSTWSLFVHNVDCTYLQKTSFKGATTTIPLTFIRFLKMWNDHDHNHNHNHVHNNHHHLTRSLSDAYGVPTSHQGKSLFARLRMNLGKISNVVKSLFLAVNFTAMHWIDLRKERSLGVTQIFLISTGLYIGYSPPPSSY